MRDKYWINHDQKIYEVEKDNDRFTSADKSVVLEHTYIDQKGCWVLTLKNNDNFIKRYSDFWQLTPDCSKPYYSSEKMNLPSNTYVSRKKIENIESNSIEYMKVHMKMYGLNQFLYLKTHQRSFLDGEFILNRNSEYEYTFSSNKVNIVLNKEDLWKASIKSELFSFSFKNEDLFGFYSIIKEKSTNHNGVSVLVFKPRA